MRTTVDYQDNSIAVRCTVPRNKISDLELFIFLPPEMNLGERNFDAAQFLDLKSSRYRYSVSKVKLPLLKQRSGNSESRTDFPIFLKTFKVKLSKLAREALSVDDIERFVKTSQALLADLRDVPVDDNNRNEFRSADELCSYYAEQFAYLCADRLSNSNERASLEPLFTLAEQERDYRSKSYGIKSKEAQHIRRKEDYFCKSINLTREGRKLTVLREQVAFSISAFLSMLLTTLVVFYFQSGYGTFSFAVFVALCVSYIFKDRFKELFRVFVAKKLNKGRFRVRAKLTDFDGRVVGKCFDLAEFVTPDDHIQNVRGKGKFRRVDADESVLLYKKRYHIEREIKPGFSEIRDTLDINLSPLLALLPDISLSQLSLNKGSLAKKNYAMLYDINLIIRTNNTSVERYRLKVSHRKIKRLDLVKT